MYLNTQEGIEFNVGKSRPVTFPDGMTFGYTRGNTANFEARIRTVKVKFTEEGPILLDMTSFTYHLDEAVPLDQRVPKAIQDPRAGKNAVNMQS